MADDRIKREIEDILSRLDDLPAERKPIRMRRRSRRAASFANDVFAPLARLSIRHVMIASFVLIVVGFVTGRAYADFGRWTLIAGVLLFVTAIVLSAFNRGGSVSDTPEKRWRGQPVHLESPTLGERLRNWFNAKRRDHN